MVVKIAATVTILSWLIGSWANFANHPYPWNTTWKTVVAGLSAIVFWIALPTTLISFIWSVL